MKILRKVLPYIMKPSFQRPVHEPRGKFLFALLVFMVIEFRRASDSPIFKALARLLWAFFSHPFSGGFFPRRR
jgi:hypothetical protein